MSRIPRKSLQTNFLHIMVQGINKEYIFAKNEYIEFYLNLIHKYQEEYPITIISYCIMNNHAHILTYVEDINMLGKFMHKINLCYSMFYNRLNNRCGVIFRNRYRVEPIYDIRYLVNCINYIHLNPVKAHIVEECWQYPYSSYLDYYKNSGVCKSKVMREIFGESFDFSSILAQSTDYLFMDNDAPNHEELSIQIKNGLLLFVKQNNVNIADIFSERMTLKKLIYFLKFDYAYKLKYTEICKALNIPRSVLLRLKLEQ